MNRNVPAPLTGIATSVLGHIDDGEPYEGVLVQTGAAIVTATASGDRLTVNVAGVYALNAKIEGANASPPPPMGGTGQGIAAYSTDMSQLEVDFGLCYRF